MDNLLLTETAYRQLANRLAPAAERVRAVRMQPDGTLQVDGRTVDSQEFPIHLCWLSGDLFRSSVVQAFIEAMTASNALRWVQTVTAGLDHPMFKSLIHRGVRLTNSDAQAPAIAEYVVGSVLYHYQRFPERVERQQAKRWEGIPFREIHGTRWLIVGFGNIGRRIGRMVRAFEGDVTGVKRTAAPVGDADRIIAFEQLGAHVGAADVVVLACALTEQTRGLLDAGLIAAMKPGAVLVNIARGEIVDEAALLDALDRGHLDYAVLDVFQQEPLPPDSPFWRHPRVLLTPHASNQGAGTGVRGVELFVGNLMAYLGGEPLRNEVDASAF